MTPIGCYQNPSSHWQVGAVAIVSSPCRYQRGYRRRTPAQRDRRGAGGLPSTATIDAGAGCGEGRRVAGQLRAERRSVAPALSGPDATSQASSRASHPYQTLPAYRQQRATLWAADKLSGPGAEWIPVVPGDVIGRTPPPPLPHRATCAGSISFPPLPAQSGAHAACALRRGRQCSTAAAAAGRRRTSHRPGEYYRYRRCIRAHCQQVTLPCFSSGSLLCLVPSLFRSRPAQTAG